MCPYTSHHMGVLSMASTVSAICPPQSWPGSFGVGGALVQSHLCCASVGEGWGYIAYTPVGLQQTGEKDELCVCVRACVCVCVCVCVHIPQSTPPHPHSTPTTTLHRVLQVPDVCIYEDKE